MRRVFDGHPLKKNENKSETIAPWTTLMEGSLMDSMTC